jgi:hypothetical protein
MVEHRVSGESAMKIVPGGLLAIFATMSILLITGLEAKA